MISPKTAQILKYSGLFLLVLFFNSFDLAVTVTLSLYLAINSKTYIKLLGFSLVLFILDMILRNFDISFRFISDLLLDSYILLLTAVYIYTKSQKRITDFFRQVSSSGRKIFSSNNLVLLVVSSILVLLLLPILGTSIAVIIGYLSFSYFSKHFEGRYAYAVGLFFLFFCPFFIIAKKDSISENFAIISFYLLIIGTIQEVVGLVQKHKVEQDDRIIHKSFAFSLPKINFGVSERLRPIMKLIVIAGITGLLSFAVISTIITPKAQKMTPTITAKPSVSPIIPTPTIDTVLELMVENGTEISGLAASTAAKLKEAGFKNVQTGNAARSDYKNWEITTKKDDTVLTNYIKQVLKLETLTVIKASQSAKFDLLLTAGSELP